MAEPSFGSGPGCSHTAATLNNPAGVAVVQKMVRPPAAQGADQCAGQLPAVPADLLVLLSGCSTLDLFATFFNVLSSAPERIACGQGRTQQKYGENCSEFLHDIPQENYRSGGRAAVALPAAALHVPLRFLQHQKTSGLPNARAAATLIPVPAITHYVALRGVDYFCIVPHLCTAGGGVVAPAP